MDKFVLVLAAALCFSTSAIAEVTCHTDAFGDVNCTGYDKDGHYVNTTSHKDAFGDVTTTGHIEGEENFVGDSEIIALGGASNETKDRPLG